MGFYRGLNPELMLTDKENSDERFSLQTLVRRAWNRRLFRVQILPTERTLPSPSLPSPDFLREPARCWPGAGYHGFKDKNRLFLSLDTPGSFVGKPLRIIPLGGVLRPSVTSM